VYLLKYLKTIYWISYKQFFCVRRNAFKLVQSYLSQITQYVHGANTKPSIKLIIAGHSLDSILGAIFFLLFINDLPNSNLIKIIFFADDTVLVHSDNNQRELQNLVNFEMTKVMDWIFTLNIYKKRSACQSQINM